MAIGVYDVIVSINNLHPIPINERDLLEKSSLQFKHKFLKQSSLCQKPAADPLYKALTDISDYFESYTLLRELFWLIFCSFYQTETIDLIGELRNRVNGLYKQLHVRILHSVDSRPNRGVPKYFIDKCLEILPFLLGNAIYNGFREHFKSSQTLFSIEFCGKVMQLICFEMMGIRVSLIYVLQQFMGNFKNESIIEAMRQPKKQIIEKDESTGSVLSSDEKEKMQNANIVKEVKERKAAVLKKCQMHRNQLSLPKMKKRIEDFLNAEEKRRMRIMSAKSSVPIPSHEVNEDFILNEDKIISGKYKNNPKAERRNNPAIVLCTMVSPYMHKNLGKKLTGHREVKVNMSRFKKNYSKLYKKYNKPIFLDPRTKYFTKEDPVEEKIAKLGPIQKIQKSVKDKMARHYSIYEEIIANKEDDIVEELDTENVPMSNKMLEDEKKRRQYAKIKDFKYLPIAMSDRAEFMECMGNEIKQSIEQHKLSEIDIKRKIAYQNYLLNSAKHKKEIEIKNKGLCSTQRSLKGELPPSKMSTYLAMSIIKSNKQALLHSNLYDYNDEFEKDMEQHKKLLMSHTNTIRNEVKVHGLSATRTGSVNNCMNIP